MARGRDVRGKIRRVTSIDVLDDAAVDGIAALCRRSLADPPTAEELAAVPFTADQPALVRGDPGVGVVATGEGGGNGFVKLVRPRCCASSSIVATSGATPRST